MSASYKVGILRLGRVAGKIKYALIDATDIPLVEDFAVEARVEIDRNGDGATIYVYCFDCRRGRRTSQKLHEMLWECRRGGVAEGYKVSHRNHITMDNRQENLCLVPDHQRVPPIALETVLPPNRKHEQNCLYWTTVLQLMNDPNEQRYPEACSARYYDSDGRVMESGNGGTNESFMYYECHYPPCSKMEQELREFSICGRCQFVRYCGVQCQERDWFVHKNYCKEKLSPYLFAARKASNGSRTPVPMDTDSPER